MAENNGQTDMLTLSKAEKMSVITTAALALVFIAAAWVTYSINVPFVLAISLGCIGGLIHELFQSGGKVLFFARKEDGLYLGSLGGMVLGGVSGLLSSHAVAGTDPAQLQALAYDAFLAGVGMKGLMEAATGTAVTTTDQGTRPPVVSPLPDVPERVQPPTF